MVPEMKNRYHANGEQVKLEVHDSNEIYYHFLIADSSID